MLGEPLCRGDRTLVAFAARPCFRLPHELPQLAEHDRGISARSVERVDALEPGKDGARFLHVNDATGGDVSACAQLCNVFATYGDGLVAHSRPRARCQDDSSPYERRPG